MKTYKQLTEEILNFENWSDNQLIRKGMVEELKAINLYETLAAQAKDSRVKELFLDIAQEEKVHAHEFEELLERIDNTWEEAEEDAEEEIEDMFGKEETEEEE